MNFNIRKIQEEDLLEIFSWFENRSWPQPPIDGIAPTWGMIAEKEGVFYACIWAYTTSTSLAFVEWAGTNPQVSQEDSMVAIDQLFLRLQQLSQETDPPISALCFYTQSEKFSERLKKLGFRSKKNMIRSLWVA